MCFLLFSWNRTPRSLEIITCLWDFDLWWTRVVNALFFFPPKRTKAFSGSKELSIFDGALCFSCSMREINSPIFLSSREDQWWDNGFEILFGKIKLSNLMFILDLFMQSISKEQAKRFTKFRERKGLIEKDVVSILLVQPFWPTNDLYMRGWEAICSSSHPSH